MNMQDFEGKHIAFTGSRGAMIAGERYFWLKWKDFLIEVISQYVGNDYWWHVGDCSKGVDELIRTGQGLLSGSRLESPFGDRPDSPLTTPHSPLH